MGGFEIFSHMCIYGSDKKTTEIYMLPPKPMRQREVVVEFRTPQHPSLGTNNWGGASPLLARNIPKESLEVRYLKLNSIRTRDEVFAIPDDGHGGYFNHVNAKKHECPTTPSRTRNKGLVLKLLFKRKEKTHELGSNQRRKSWLPRWDPQNRWPQGWG